MESVDGDERESLTTGSEEGKGTVLDWLVDGKSMGGGGVGGFWSRGGWIGGSFVNVALPSQLLLSFFQMVFIAVCGLEYSSSRTGN